MLCCDDDNVEVVECWGWLFEMECDGDRPDGVVVDCDDSIGMNECCWSDSCVLFLLLLDSCCECCRWWLLG